MAESTITENWKQKYYKAVIDQDYLEQDNKKGLEQLYKELLRALGHYQGRDPEIDEVLDSLPSQANLKTIPFDEIKRLNYKITQVQESSNRLPEKQAIDKEAGQDSKIDPLTVAKESLHYFIEDLPKLIADRMAFDEVELAIKEANDSNTLRGIIDGIIEVLGTVLDTQERGVIELSCFLGTVINRLEGFKSHFEEEKSSRKSSLSERKKFGDFLGANLNEIRVSIAEAESIEKLQAAIDSRIEEIDSEVTSFVHQEIQRADKAEKSSVALEGQLEKLNLETIQLRKSLEVARTDAIVDPLTNVSNRRAYNERFNVEYTRWKRYREPLTLAIMDIDHFKSINDAYGHPIGDKVLKIVAERIQSQVRESDFFGRIGGEEFAFILVNSDIESAMGKVESLRESVESCQLTVKTEKLQVTISIGIATFREDDSIETIYQRADEALIKAKQTGRNKSLSELDL